MRVLPMTLALLLASMLGVSPVRAQDADLPPAIEETLKRLPPEARQMTERLFREMAGVQNQLPAVPPPLPGFGRSGGVAFGRLGASVESPSDALADQLDLPKGQGIVLKSVQEGSAAGKAGLKAHDVLLEIDGKPVAREVQDFDKQLEKIKEGQAVSLTLLRKGKTETIKELKLPKLEANNGLVPGMPGVEMAVPFHPPVPALLPEMLPIGAGLGGPVGNGVLTTVFRSANRFTARHQEGSLIITVTGQDNKAKEIRVQDGRESNTYESINKVPVAYRDKVRNLAEMVEKSNSRIEIPKP